MLTRCLDKFLIKDSPMDKFVKIKQWVASGGILDQSPIDLEIFGASPFKLNSTWLRDEGYHLMVKHTW